jgi:subtilisin family serine protease
MAKKINLLFVCIGIIALCTSTANGQQNTNMYLAQKIKANEHSLIDVFVKGNIEHIKNLTVKNGGVFKDAAGDIALVRIAPKKLSSFFSDKSIESIEAYPNKAKPLNDTLLINLNAKKVHTGDAPLTQAYTGSGVVIGFMDTGIDFTHPDFKNSNGTTRVKFIWDQTLTTSTNTPSPFGYGQEFTASDIDNGLANAHQDTYWGGHGTQVVGMAASNGLASGQFKGVAPDADIIMVAIDFYNNTNAVIADGVNYIYSKASAMGKPCVINASLGSNSGPHDGKDNESQYIKNKINQSNGRALVAACGNDGNTKSHLGYSVSTDTSFTWFENNNGSIYIQLWANSTNFSNVNFAIGVDQLNPTYSNRGSTAFSTIADHLGILKYDTIFNAGNKIGVVLTYGSLINGNYSMEFLIQPDTASYVWSLKTCGAGRFDTWSYDIKNTGLPSLMDFPAVAYYKLGDNDQTVMGGFQCLDNVISVGNYVNVWGYMDYTNTPFFQQDYVTGSLAPNSSQGPTRDNRYKPDITAPGDMTLTTYVLSLIPDVIANFPDALTQDGFHIRSGGTSMASPCVAGTVALYFERFNTATALQVKNEIKNCTIQDAFTGSILPDYKWGYGKANTFGVVSQCQTVSINENDGNSSDVLLFPNPSSTGQEINLTLSNFNVLQNYQVSVFSAIGSKVWEQSINKAQTSLKLNLESGIYLCQIMSGKQNISTKKIIIQ